MRHTRSKTKSRRSHHALEKPTLFGGKEGKTPSVRHRANSVTGEYRGKKVASLEKKFERKQQRKRDKAKELGEEVKEK